MCHRDILMGRRVSVPYPDPPKGTDYHFHFSRVGSRNPVGMVDSTSGGTEEWDKLATRFRRVKQ